MSNLWGDSCEEGVLAAEEQGTAEGLAGVGCGGFEEGDSKQGGVGMLIVLACVIGFLIFVAAFLGMMWLVEVMEGLGEWLDD